MIGKIIGFGLAALAGIVVVAIVIVALVGGIGAVAKGSSLLWNLMFPSQFAATPPPISYGQGQCPQAYQSQPTCPQYQQPTYQPAACPGIRVYIDDAGTHGAGDTTVFTSDQIYLAHPWFGGISWVSVPNGCMAVLHDVADGKLTNWYGTTLVLGPGEYNLQAIARDNSQTPYITSQTCENGLTWCWSDATVAIQVLHQ